MDEPTTTTADTSTATVTTGTEQATTASESSTPSAPPRSFREAVAQMESAEGAPEDREPATTAQETTPEGQKPEPTKPARKAGPIPFEVHETALKNARTKAIEEARPQIEQEIRQRYAWADVVEEPDREELSALYRGLKTDLIGTLTTLIDNASQHPEHAKTLRSQAARLLSAARRVQGESATDDDEPQPDIPLEDGRAVYSAEQLAKRDAWRERRLMAQFDQKLQPFQQDREAAQRATAFAELTQRATQIREAYEAKPHFTEHKAEIAALMQANPEMTIGDAYAEILTTKVLPGAKGEERAAVLADIHRKAGAGTLNPAQTTTGTPTKPTGRFTPALVEQFFAETGAA